MKYIKKIGNKEHLLYNKDNFTFEVWEGTRRKTRTYSRDFYPISDTHRAVRACNDASIEQARTGVLG